MKKAILIDANIVIRFLLGDHPEFSPKAKIIFSKAQEGFYVIYLDEVVVAEVIWTLSSYYRIAKTTIVNQLEKLVSQDWIINPRKKILLQTLFLYKAKNLDYIDCWIFTVNSSLKTSLETFDYDLKKIK